MLSKASWSIGVFAVLRLFKAVACILWFSAGAGLAQDKELKIAETFIEAMAISPDGKGKGVRTLFQVALFRKKGPDTFYLLLSTNYAKLAMLCLLPLVWVRGADPGPTAGAALRWQDHLRLGYRRGCRGEG